MATPRVQLKRIVKIINGGTPTPAEENWNGEIPWATPVDLNNVDGGFIGTTLRNLSEIGVRTGSVLVPEGSVILSTRAPIGYTAVATNQISFNQGCKALVPLRPAETDSRYLRYAIQASVENLEALGKGSTFLELSTSDLASFRIPWPEYQVQKRIADELDRELAEIDEFIADQIKLKELLKEQFEAQKEQIILEAGGQQVRLSRVLKGLKDGTHGTHPRVDSGGEVLLSAKNISSGELVISENESRISLEEAAQITESGFPRKGDVMMILVGATYGRTALYNLEQTLPFQRSVGFFRPNEELITSDYLKLVMSSREFQQQLSLGIKTSAQPGIYLGDVSSCRITLPSINNQIKFTAIHDKRKFNHKGLRKSINQSIRILSEKKYSSIENKLIN